MQRRWRPKTPRLVGQPAFVRNPEVDLQTAITHLVALKSVFAEQLAS